jgi:hypothetical protein
MIRILGYLFLLAVAALAIATAFQYQGQLAVYLLFTVVGNALLLNGFRKKAIYFDTFIGIFLWLGFWLKLSIRVAFIGGMFFEQTGAFDRSPDAFDKALIVASCGMAALLAASLVRQRFFAYSSDLPSCAKSGIFVFYRTYRKLFLLVFIGLVLFATVSNVAMGVYQRGMVAQTILPFGLNGIYKWLLQFGLASVSALIIRFEIELNSNVSLVAIVVPLLESFLSNVSLLSRGMILNSFALMLGGAEAVRGRQKRVSAAMVMIAIVSFVVLFATSVLVVNYLRAVSLGGNDSMAVAHRMAAPLIIDRWVGMEGVMAVSSSKRLGWDIWSESWREEFQEGQLSLYDRIFIDSPYNDPRIDKTKHHFVSLPGMVAFLYYPGSLSFLFVVLFTAGLLAAGLEALVYRLSGRNWLLCALFGQVIAFRYASFGYVPSQSYLLFGTLALNALIIYVIDTMLDRHLARTQ